MDADVLIIGQGLAGSTLAWRLIERDVQVVVADPGHTTAAGAPSASRVAAGLITPVTGRRLTVDPEYDRRWRAAHDFYHQVVQARCGLAVLEERPAVRLFANDDEAAEFEHRLSDADYACHARAMQPNEAPEGVARDHGGCVLPGAARLRVADYLDATRRWLDRAERFFNRWVREEELQECDGARMRIESIDVTARSVVFCVGYDPAPRWSAPRLAPAKGEVLTVEIPFLHEQRVVHRGVWIAPDESRRPGLYRVGATYDRNDLSTLPTPAGRRWLLNALDEAGVAVAGVLDHQAAVRPATVDRRPTYGFRPDRSRIGWFNGLGSKGALLAPEYAERMADLIVESLRD